MTTTEPEWDAETRDLVLALDAVPTCPSCGRDPALCQDINRQFHWRVPAPNRCHATTALLERQKRLDDVEHPDALTWKTYLDTGTDTGTDTGSGGGGAAVRGVAAELAGLLG